MKALSCAEVEEHIELFAAGECPPPLAEQIEAHLAQCPACSRSFHETQQLLGLLDLRFQEAERLRRLQERLAAEDARRVRTLRFRRLAIAAAVLVAVGLGAWLLPALWRTGNGAPVELAGVTVVWASPDAQWKPLTERKIELTAGELWLRSAGPSDALPALEVVTPVATATARGTEFTVDIRPAAAGSKGGTPMRWKTLVYVSVLGGLVQLSNSLGTVTGSRGEALAAEEKEAPKKQVENLAQRFGRYYKPVAVNVKPSIPALTLPVDLDKVANFEQAAKALGLKADEASLKANGFVVLPGAVANEDIVAPYKDIAARQVPVVITSDTLLHLYHIQFDETLREIEEREFYPDIVALTKGLVNQLEAAPLPADTEDFRAARQKALTYLAVGLKALDPQAPLPKGVAAADVDLVLEKMKKHEGFWPDPVVAEKEWPLFRYSEDFSQYLPRGHYTRSETLKKYFVGMMWFGRMTFLLKGSPSRNEALVSVPESNQQTLAASMLTKLLAQTELADKRKARDVWERIYAVTAFYVGLADDLGMQEYQAALHKVCGAALDLAQLNGGQKLLELKADLARHSPPAIYSGTGQMAVFNPSGGPEELVKALDKSQGFRLMGQRFVPDSYILGKMVYPTIGDGTRADVFTAGKTGGGSNRNFPRGLDVMAVLGSARARAITRELGDDAYKHGRGPDGAGDALSYDEALAALQKEYGKLSDADWNHNLYWSWLHALKPLLSEHGAGYPTFMTTQAYRTKSLNTALASWAQLRHDTILYAKQSYTMTFGAPPNRTPTKPVQGYVEPLPEFYARLLALARMTNQGLAQMKVLDDAAAKRLDAFEKLLERLLALSEKELANQELTDDDYKFIRGFGTHIEAVVKAPSARARQLARDIAQAREAKDFKRVRELSDQLSLEQDPALKTTIIADVHTDQNSKMVLEEGTGPVDLGVFIYLQPDGQLALGAGPVLSYYEFKHPMGDRLTDEKWRETLKKKSPAQPEWTRTYLSEKTRYECPEKYSQRMGMFP